MRITEAQRANLEHVKLFGEAKPRSRAGYWCRHHGLSEWLYRTERGVFSQSVHGALPRPLPDDLLIQKIVGERLTPAGLAALREGRE